MVLSGSERYFLLSSLYLYWYLHHSRSFDKEESQIIIAMQKGAPPISPARPRISDIEWNASHPSQITEAKRCQWPKSIAKDPARKNNHAESIKRNAERGVKQHTIEIIYNKQQQSWWHCWRLPLALLPDLQGLQLRRPRRTFHPSLQLVTEPMDASSYRQRALHHQKLSHAKM